MSLSPPLRVLLLSPYHGGSHQAWAEGYRRHSAAEITLLTLPAHFWKWRMHGGAVTLARAFLADERLRGRPFDLILATDMLDLTTFLSLTRRHTAGVPAAIYMHENQLTYPLPADPTTGPMRRQMGERDRHYAFINYVSMLAADRVYFNSAYHRETLFAALTPFLRHYPEYNEIDTIAILREKSEVLPVGIDLRRLDRPPAPPRDEPPLVLWNQRLEYDKGPERAVAALNRLAAEGIPFRVALCGERFGVPSDVWRDDVAALGERVIHNGFADDDHYAQLLWEAAVVLSTADHEYFGISILEAVYARTFPVLPARLSYPEILPAPFHEACLYRTRAQLDERLRWALANPAAAAEMAAELASATARFDWSVMAPRYDAAFSALAR